MLALVVQLRGTKPHSTPAWNLQAQQHHGQDIPASNAAAFTLTRPGHGTRQGCARTFLNVIWRSTWFSSLKSWFLSACLRCLSRARTASSTCAQHVAQGMLGPAKGWQSSRASSAASNILHRVGSCSLPPVGRDCMLRCGGHVRQ